MGELTLVIRSLLRQPSFTLAAVGTLALGIAASTAVFSTVNAALLRPLPYPEADRIYSLRTAITDGRFTNGMVAHAELLSLKAATRDVERAAAARRMNLAATTDVGAIDAVAYGVSADFFPLFGAQVSHGRGFAPEEFERNGTLAVVISHRAWMRYFGGDPAVVGKSIQFSAFSAPVIGVAAPGFDMPADVDFWINNHLFPDNIGHNNHGYIRLAPGVGIESLRDPMASVMQALGERFPDQNQDRVFVASPLRDAIVGDLRSVLWILFFATAFLLVIAGANFASLMLARGTARAREMAVRGALGASRSRLVRQVLAESMILAAAGGALGVAAAIGAVSVLQSLGASQLPRLDDVPFDFRVAAFAVLTIAAMGLVSGLVPALVTARADVAPILNAGGRSALSGPLTRRLLGSMAIAQIAFAVALVGGAGRLVRSFENLSNQDRGFTSEPRLIVDANLPYRFGDTARTERWLSDAEARLRSLGATAVAAVSSVPLRPELDTTTHVDIVNDPNIAPRYRPNARLRYITPGFLDVMGIRLIAGRPFSDRDRRDTPPVILINESFARQFLEGRDPLLEQLSLPGFWTTRRGEGFVTQPAQVIGVVADTLYTALDKTPEQTVYLTMAQAPLRRLSFVVQAQGRDLDALGREAQAALRQLDARVPVEIDTMQGAVDASLSRQRLGMVLMSAFGVAALALAAVGVFGVVAFVVSQRTNEMAVRMAIGASARQVFTMVMRQGGSLVAAGAAGGLLLSWWTGRLMTSYVYHVASLDPVVIGISAGAVAFAGALATAILAGRASRVSPSRVLRTGA